MPPKRACIAPAFLQYPQGDNPEERNPEQHQQNHRWSVNRPSATVFHVSSRVASAGCPKAGWKTACRAGQARAGPRQARAAKPSPRRKTCCRAVRLPESHDAAKETRGKHEALDDGGASDGCKHVGPGQRRIGIKLPEGRGWQKTGCSAKATTQKRHLVFSRAIWGIGHWAPFGENMRNNTGILINNNLACRAGQDATARRAKNIKKPGQFGQPLSSG